MNADQIRRKTIDLRNRLSPDEVSRLSSEVATRFLEFCRIDNLENLKLGFYRALPHELDLKYLVVPFKKAQCRLFYPRVMSRQSRSLEFVEVQGGLPKELPPEELPGEGGSEMTWKIGPYGIEEPHSDLKTVVAAEELDLIFVPGVAFGESGERIGMGAGYYDRYLARASAALKVALTFDFQLFPSLPQSATDHPLHWVVTEKREYRHSFVTQWLIQKGIS